MARRSFPAGVALDAHKRDSAATLIDLPPPYGTLVLPLDQGSGGEAEACVQAGDRVAFGSVIARGTSLRAATLHAPVPGQVVAIEVREADTDSGRSLCIVLEPDGRDDRDSSLHAHEDFASLDPVALIDALRDAGIAGLGGAGFPAATKLKAAREHAAPRLLLNGAECEPWISCDDALMRAQADDVVLGARVLRQALAAQACTIAVEDDKPEAIAALQAALQAPEADGITVTAVPAIYPRGAERQLLTAVYGDEVPSGSFPASLGVVVQNVATAAAIARWVRTGEPCVTRIVTVTGHGVARPCNVRAPLGTPLAALIGAAGGYAGEPLRLIAGGNMTGRAVASDEVTVNKALNCVLVATHEDLEHRIDAFERPCIRCGDCADACPAGLLPQQLFRAALIDDEAGLQRFGLFDCIDCGCCDYVCPSQIPLAHRFRLARGQLRERMAAARMASDAKAHHERRQRRLEVQANEERAAFDAARHEARTSPPDQAGPG